MFHATIHSDAVDSDAVDRFHLSGDVVPYDLEVLRQHVMARRGRRTRLEVRLPAAHRAAFVRAFRDLARRGVDLVIAS